MKNYKYAFTVLLSGFVVLFGLTNCDSGGSLVETPPPFLEFIEAPFSGDTLTVDNVLVSWKGSEDNFLFKYSLQYWDDSDFPIDYIPWTEYDEANEVSLSNLDEGRYQIQVMGYSGNIESTHPITRNFFVDAVQGPSLLFFKTETTVEQGLTDSISVFMEEVEVEDSLSAFEVLISYEPEYLELMDIKPGRYSTTYFDQLIVPDYSNPDVLAEANSDGNIQIDSAFLMNLTSQSNCLDGSGEILRLVFKALRKGETELEFITIKLKKPNGENIPPNITRKAIVNIL